MALTISTTGMRDESTGQYVIVFAHGFYVLSDEAIFTYKCTDFYDPKGEGGLMWNDPAIAIDWKAVAPDVDPLLSDKDGKHPAFDAAKNYFDINGKWIG